MHITDGERRIALVQTRVRGHDRGPRRLVHYQLDDQLGSSRIELDGSARILSTEEYHPYGTSAVRTMASQLGRGLQALPLHR